MQNFVTKAGNDFNLDLTFTQDANPLDITNATIKLFLKRRRDLADDADGVVVVNADITNGSGGLCSIEMNAQLTAELQGTYFYYVQYTDENAVVDEVLEGVITFDDK